MSDESKGSSERLLIEAALRDAEEWEAASASRTLPIGFPAADLAALQHSFPSYQLVRELHRGGQGVVVQAVHKATKRKVAIKLLREGILATPRERARFDREMQILGQLNDSRIVQVHDSSVVGGCAYYVMDYISGHALDHFLTEKRLSVRDTLDLFGRICDAVNSAHLRGVIHRDLKPSNIRIDPDGQPHILDFGLAKVTGEMGGDSEPQLMSITGEFIGSLPWASPEQAEGVPDRIDIRTDVYSLGVILFQMLTGNFPYPVVGSMRSVLDNIIRADPLKPRALRKEIDDEVETMVLKCLAKDRDRRYQTAGELARDVRHYLRGEPIDAKRDSAAYVLRKALARHKLHVAVAAALLFVVGLSVGVAAYYGERAKLAGERARMAETEGKRTLKLLRDAFGAADPEVNVRTVKEAVDRAATALSGQLGLPRLEAELHRTLGEIYLKVDAKEEAKLHLDRAQTIYDESGVENSLSLVQVRLISGKLAYAEGDYTAALDAWRSALKTLRELNTSPEIELAVADCINCIATVHERYGRFAEAEPFFEEAVSIRRRLAGERSLEFARSVNNLARCYREQGRWSEAEAQFTIALKLFQELFGRDSPRVAKVEGSLGDCLLRAGKCAEAKVFLEDSLAHKRAAITPDQGSIIKSVGDLTRWYLDCQPEGIAAADELCGQLFTLAESSELPENEGLAELHRLRGQVRRAQDRVQDAEADLRRALDILLHKVQLGEAHWRVIEVNEALGTCLIELKRFPEAREILSRAHGNCRLLPPALRETYGTKCAQSLARLAERSGSAMEATTTAPRVEESLP